VPARLSRAIKVAGVFLAAIVAVALAMAPSAFADASPTKALADGSFQTTYTIGPLTVNPGQNRIDNKPIVGAERPSVDGWITKIQPNLVYADGTIPSSSKVMFHHGVWINVSRGNQQFFATGEEKTNMEFPAGYGYRYKASDIWYLNHMIHNLTPEAMTLYATYTVDFIPDTAPAAAGMKPAEPIWMDVQRGSGYPVFDSYRGSGENGVFTYPQDQPDAYAPGVHKNQWTVPHDGTLLGTTGHVHTGGLYTDLYLSRNGASYQGPSCDAPADHSAEIAAWEAKMNSVNKKIAKLRKSMKPRKVRSLNRKMKPAKFKVWKKKKAKALKKLRKLKSDRAAKKAEFMAQVAAEQKAYSDCQLTQPQVDGNRVRIFRSDAHYFEPAGPVSWDMAMMSTPENWKVGVKAGDKLDIQAAYETKIASWYENMGIDVVFWTPDTGGRDPYTTNVNRDAVLNHGHYAENDDHGGTTPVVGPDPTTLANGAVPPGQILIKDFTYGAGDFRLPGETGKPPTIQQGQTLTFKLDAGDAAKQQWHSLTSCKTPCNKSTGIAYPIADGDFQFDSGQLGNHGAPTVGRETWTTPPDLTVGTHTFFCRIHPLMRGAIRVVKAPGT